MQESEVRSHAFFFQPGATGGNLALTLNSTVAGGYGWWGSGVSNLAFFTTTTAGQLALHGIVSSTVAAGGTCETSCIDW